MSLNNNIQYNTIQTVSTTSYHRTQRILSHLTTSSTIMPNRLSDCIDTLMQHTNTLTVEQSIQLFIYSCMALNRSIVYTIDNARIIKVNTLFTATLSQHATNQALVALILQSIQLLYTLTNQPDTRNEYMVTLYTTHNIVLQLIAIMKQHRHSRHILLQCITILQYIHIQYTITIQYKCTTTTNKQLHPFINQKLHGVTLYRRLYDICSTGEFISYKSLLTPCIDLLYTLLELNCTENKKYKSLQCNHERILHRILQGTADIMQLSNHIVFGHTNAKSIQKKHIRTTPTRLLKSLVMCIQRLSTIDTILPRLVELGVIEWCLAVLQLLRDYPVSVSSVMNILYLCSIDHTHCIHRLIHVLNNDVDDKLLKFVEPYTDGRPLLFRHTRDIIWNIQLIQYGPINDESIYGSDTIHELDTAQYGVSRLDYWIGMNTINQQRSDIINELESELLETESHSGSMNDTDDESDRLKDELMNQSYVDELRDERTRDNSIVDHDDSSSDIDDCSDGCTNLAVTDDINAATKRLHLNGIRSDSETDDNEQNTIDSAQSDNESSDNITQFNNAPQHHSSLSVSTDPNHIINYRTELLNQNERNDMVLKFNKEIQLNTTKSVRSFIDVNDSNSSLLHTTLFNRTSTMDCGAANLLPEPLDDVRSTAYLQQLKQYRTNNNNNNKFIPYIVYDRNLLDNNIPLPSPPIQNHTSVEPLQFESRFECGNCARVVRIDECEYNIYLQPDINTNCHTQWFFYSISNTQSGISYKFNIVNLEKKTSAFNKGMRPCIYSEQLHELTGTGFHRSTMLTDIFYYPNHRIKPSRMTKVQSTLTRMISPQIQSTQTNRTPHTDITNNSSDTIKDDISNLLSSINTSHVTPDLHNPLITDAPVLRRTLPKSNKTVDTEYYYTLTYTYKSTTTNDVIYMTHFYPYTYTYLCHRLHTLQSQCNYMTRQPLCYTRSGNLCELLTITDYNSSVSDIQNRPVIVLSSRIHPGETNASWMIDGLIQYILSNANEAQYIRTHCIVKIIPMLNIDGVVNGNYRCSLTGDDLNRYWSHTGTTHPTIHYTKLLIDELAAQNKLLLYCDWHGHSTMANFALYGSVEEESSLKPRPPTVQEQQYDSTESWLDVVPPDDIQLRSRIFPMLLHQRASNLLQYDECTFFVTPGKRGSARVSVWEQYRIDNCYTLEGSFYGSDYGEYNSLHYNTSHYMKFGELFAVALYDLINHDKSKLQYAYQQCKFIQQKK